MKNERDLRATDGAFSMTDRITQFHGSFRAILSQENRTIFNLD